MGEGGGYFPGAIKVSVSTANITASQILSHYALCQGLPSNALDYQSPFTPYGPVTGRTGLRVPVDFYGCLRYFRFPFWFGRHPVQIRYCLENHRETPAPFNGDSCILYCVISAVQDSKGCFTVVVLSAPAWFPAAIRLCMKFTIDNFRNV